MTLSDKKPSQRLVQHDADSTYGEGIEIILDEFHTSLLELRGKVADNTRQIADLITHTGIRNNAPVHPSPDPSAASEWPKFTKSTTLARCVFVYPSATECWKYDGDTPRYEASVQMTALEADITYAEAIALIPAIEKDYPLTRPATPAESKPASVEESWKDRALAAEAKLRTIAETATLKGKA